MLLTWVIGLDTVFLASLPYLSSFSLSVTLTLVLLFVGIFVSLIFVAGSLREVFFGFKVGLSEVVADLAALFEGGFERVVDDYWS